MGSARAGLVAALAVSSGPLLGASKPRHAKDATSKMSSHKDQADKAVHFKLTPASDLQDALFGDAVRQGWLGAEGAGSFELPDGRFLWLFGDSFTNLTAVDEANAEGRSLAGCNYYASQWCAMPTNTVATWQRQESPAKSQKASNLSSLNFHVRMDNRSGHPVSTFWAPGWGGRGRTPKAPECDSCSLWSRPEGLRFTLDECLEKGATAVQNNKGGCCSKKEFPVCDGYCCKSELYFQPISGITSKLDDRVLILANMGKQSSNMPNMGETFATYVISVDNSTSSGPPASWGYTSERMPGTTVWPWSEMDSTVQLHYSILPARQKEFPDRVYLFGKQGASRVLARADLSDLLDYHWRRVEFLMAPGQWQHYTESEDIPDLHPLWKSKGSKEPSLYFDESLELWVSPEMDSQGKNIVARVSTSAEGPYAAWKVGRLPSDFAAPSIDRWDVSSVRMHPELSSDECKWVLSVILHWKDVILPPPLPGLHAFPRLLCVKALPSLSKAVKELEELKLQVATTGQDAAAAGGCPPEKLDEIQNRVACSEDSDGCHTCRERASWIVQNNARTLDVAYSIVAAEFPDDCSDVMLCKDELASLGELQQAWAVEKSIGREPDFAAKVAAITATSVFLAAAALFARRTAGSSAPRSGTDEESQVATETDVGTPLRAGPVAATEGLW